MITPDITAWIRRNDGATFENAVQAACLLYEMRLKTKPTHCYVNPNEPDMARLVGDVVIIERQIVPLAEFWASKQTAINMAQREQADGYETKVTVETTLNAEVDTQEPPR